MEKYNVIKTVQVTKKKKKNKGRSALALIAPIRKVRAPRMSSQSVNQSWLRLLRDPCGGSIVPAPYEGTGSGYFVRTVNIQPVTVGGLSSIPTAVDFAVEATPYNMNTPFAAASQVTGGSLAFSDSTVGNFITNYSVVKSFRCVAACFKWVPSGPISLRSGVIGRVYSPAKTITPGDSTNGSIMLASMPHQEANGSVIHEVRWLPSFNDERFSSTAEVNANGVGSMSICGVNIDCTTTGVSPNIVATANGYLELTCAWEWEPHLGGGTNGIAASTLTTTGGTVRDTLSAIRNLGDFLYGNGPAIMATGYSLAAGVSRMTRGPSMPRIRY
jgi:hypothetical protein